jgi:serine phosphatase RsbU (regulator of sigma subunit)
MAQYYNEAVKREYLAKLTTQLERTGQIQRKLFQYESFPSARYDIDVTYQPLSDFHCGGDFYYIIPLSDDHCLVILGDVAGHGVEAAFVTAIVRTLISREEDAIKAALDFSPAGFLQQLNGLVMRELEKAPELVITLTVAHIDCSKLRLVMSNAGNLPIYVIRKEKCETYTVPGSPLGFTRDAAFTDIEVSLKSGDRIAFMTDGLLERGRISGYINPIAVKAVFAHFVQDPDFNRKIVNFLLELFPDRKFTDDITLITAKIR